MTVKGALEHFSLRPDKALNGLLLHFDCLLDLLSHVIFCFLYGASNTLFDFANRTVDFGIKEACDLLSVRLDHVLDGALDLGVSLPDQLVELLRQGPLLLDDGKLNRLDLAVEGVFQVTYEATAVELSHYFCEVAAHLGQQVRLPVV